MAWVEGESWDMEQGIDALKVFELFADVGQTTPYDFTGSDVNATVSDETGRTKYTCTVETEPANGIIRLLLPEATVNTLKPDRTYRYDCLLVPPGVVPADDNFVATGPVTVALRTTRRDP